MKKSKRIVNGYEVNTAIKRFVLANMLEVEAGTNGYHGGDSGHGSRAYIRITDLGGTDIEFMQDAKRSLIMKIGGDYEIESIISAMRFIANHLSYQIKNIETKDSCYDEE